MFLFKVEILNLRIIECTFVEYSIFCSSLTSLVIKNIHLEANIFISNSQLVLFEFTNIDVNYATFKKNQFINTIVFKASQN